MKRVIFTFALILGLIALTTAKAQNMSRYITLTVKNGEAIKLDFMAAAAGTPVRIVSGTNTQNITVGNGWYDGRFVSTFTVTAADTTMIVYGDVMMFRCGYNGANLTAIDLSHNTQLLKLMCPGDSIRNLDVTKNTDLTLLDCSKNRLSTLDVSKNTKLRSLDCSGNRLDTLDVSKNKLLVQLGCSGDSLSSLDISNNTNLKILDCSGNRLTSIDLSQNEYLVDLNCSNNMLSTLEITDNRALIHLHCFNNRLSSLDISRNNALKSVYCYGNKFSRKELDDIYCALPFRGAADNARICVLKNASDTNSTIVHATNANNAIFKHWKVQHYDDLTNIATNGTYTCDNGGGITPNMECYITLDVKNGKEIKLDFKAGANTPVRVVSGRNTHDIIVGTDWYDGNTPSSFTVTSQDTTIKVYGDITGFDCSGNGDNITNIYVVKNTLLKTLNCSKNSLSTLNLVLNTQLADLNCSSNQIASLDISNNRALIDLDCSFNGLTTLSLAENTSLRTLNCSNNSLQSLDVSNNKRLKNIYCYGNNFTSIALDEIYCDLPDREPVDSARIFTLNELSSASEVAVVEATNSANTTNKNWKLKKYNTNGIHTDINTIGDFLCPVEYNLYISGMRITSANCNNIPCVSGTVKYDPSTKTLTLDNATINAEKDYYQAIGSEIDGLILNVVGTNNLISTNTGIGLNESMTITGGGTLNVTTLITTTPSICAIYAAGADLIIDSCTVNAKGRWGITGHSKTDNLTIKNATVTAEGIQYGSIADFANMTLIGCSITQPAEAAFDTALHCVALNGEKVKSKVVITKNVTAIDLPIAESALTLYPNPVSDMLYLSATARTIRVYNVYGVEVAHATDTDRVEVSHLPAGVYTVKADGNIAKMIKR